MAFRENGELVYHDTGHDTAVHSIGLIKSGVTERNGDKMYERLHCHLSPQMLLHPFSLPHAGALGLHKIGLSDENVGFGIMTMVECCPDGTTRELPISSRMMWRPPGCETEYSGLHNTGYSHKDPTMLCFDPRLCSSTNSSFSDMLDRRNEDTFSFHWQHYAGCDMDNVATGCQFIMSDDTSEGCVLLVPYDNSCNTDKLSAFAYLINSKYKKEQRPDYTHTANVVRCRDILSPATLQNKLFIDDSNSQYIIFNCKDPKRVPQVQAQYEALQEGICKSCKSPFMAHGADIHVWRRQDDCNPPNPYVKVMTVRNPEFVQWRSAAEAASSIGIDTTSPAAPPTASGQEELRVYRTLMQQVCDQYMPKHAQSTQQKAGGTTSATPADAAPVSGGVQGSVPADGRGQSSGQESTINHG